MDKKVYFHFVKRVALSLFLILTETTAITRADIHVKTQERIIADLFQNYSPFIKPRKNLSEPVDVNLTLHFTSLREIDERLQTMSFIGWMELTWIDEFLILGDGLKSLQLPKSEIWYPDVALFNSIDDPQHISDGQHIILLEDGRVVWYPARQYNVRCQIDIRRFPFDEQKCQIRIGAWQSPVWIQRIADNGKSLAETLFEQNGEWEITQTITQPEVSTEYSISFVRYAVHFRRRFLHPVINTLFPVVLLSFLNTLVFLLPANSGEKMTLCISVLLSFTVFLTVFNDMMPKTSTTISYLSIYLCIQLGMSGLAIVESICIWRVNHRENTLSFKKTTNGNMANCSHDISETESTLSTLTDGIVSNDNGIPTQDDSQGRYEHHPTSLNGASVNNINIRDKTTSPKWNFFGQHFKQTYLMSDNGESCGCQLDSDRLDLMCFWLHFGITSISTTILMVMFWL
ncbi:Neuronal acetylcholine receptor subunit alpha-7 [Mizuhopecten yessoensis]|uniref:Neuronal acetylcholine receptor subunit alpha-7 n=1 Tax=Mizuhopecten yessoensis TaxID=6573 RepID=A0A210QPG5_MIZYE|nr:Neuronal acetylcholine receptor subunit alpha-7 [Mizuhopecten yessoensis]